MGRVDLPTLIIVLCVKWYVSGQSIVIRQWGLFGKFGNELMINKSLLFTMSMSELFDNIIVNASYGYLVCLVHNTLIIRRLDKN